MPAFIFVIFNRLPSGLSLYYLCYNVVTAVQQQWINKSIDAEKDKADDAGKGGKRSVRGAKATAVSKNGRQKKDDVPKKGGRQVRTK
jgi:YidC/Oxa1 family membrane protein insertase